MGNFFGGKTIFADDNSVKKKSEKQKFCEEKKSGRWQLAGGSWQMVSVAEGGGDVSSRRVGAVAGWPAGAGPALWAAGA